MPGPLGYSCTWGSRGRMGLGSWEGAPITGSSPLSCFPPCRILTSRRSSSARLWGIWNGTLAPCPPGTERLSSDTQRAKHNASSVSLEPWGNQRGKRSVACLGDAAGPTGQTIEATWKVNCHALPPIEGLPASQVPTRSPAKADQRAPPPLIYPILEV